MVWRLVIALVSFSALTACHRAADDRLPWQRATHSVHGVYGQGGFGAMP